MINVILGILIPFAGTSLGSAMVFLMKNNLSCKIEKLFLGFASGVMIAASVWSLILPAIEQSESLSVPEWFPASLGLFLGFAFLFLVDWIVFKLKKDENKVPSNMREKSMMIFAVTLHNIPEGFAVGVALAGAYFGVSQHNLTAALLLSIGIAIQNFPEGAIVSLPLSSGGMSKSKSFLMGSLSGVVEPIAGVIAFLLTGLVAPILPYILAFSAGAMIFVCIKELIPEAQEGGFENIATLGFLFGFVIMLILDVALG